MSRWAVTLALSVLAIGWVSAQDQPHLRLGLNLGVPTAVGLDLEYATTRVLFGAVRLSPALDASFVPISHFCPDSEGVYYAQGSLVLRMYLSLAAEGWFGHAGAGAILVHSDAWNDRSVYGRASAITVPVGVG